MKIFMNWLRMQALPLSSMTNAISISYSHISLCKTFISMLGSSSPPTVEFYIYDEHKEMSLHDFCQVCLIPFEGIIEEPHHGNVDGFIDIITVGETRKVSDARTTSIYFPVLHYFVIFASRCLIGRGNCGNPSTPDIVILCHALFHDDTFSMGAIISKRLNLNRTKGPVFGGIFASRLAALLGIMRSKKNCCLLFI